MSAVSILMPRSADARDTAKVLAKRVRLSKTRVSAYDPNARIPRREILKPWLAVILGSGILSAMAQGLRVSMLGGRIFALRSEFLLHRLINVAELGW